VSVVNLDNQPSTPKRTLLPVQSGKETGENNNPEPVNLAKTITTGSEEEIDKPLSSNVSSSSTEAAGSYMLKKADGSLQKKLMALCKKS